MMKTKPITEVRLGTIKAAVWKNETENGVRYNATFCRLYKDGDKWKTTDSFGRDDLLLLAKVADRTHSWIVAKNQEHEGGAKSNGSQTNEAKSDLFQGQDAPDKRPQI